MSSGINTNAGGSSGASFTPMGGGIPDASGSPTTKTSLGTGTTGTTGTIGTGATAGTGTAPTGYDDFDTLLAALEQDSGFTPSSDPAQPTLVPPTEGENVSSVNTTSLSGSAANTQILNNAFTVSNQIQQSATTINATLSSGGTNGVIMGNFLKAIANAIDTLKKALQSLQAQDANISEKLNAAKFDEMDQRRDMQKSSQKTQQDQVQKARDAANSHSKMSGIMKILGPIVAAVCMIVGAILAPTGAGLIVMAVGLAVLAYSIADSECGITQKAVSAIISAISNLSPALKGLAIAAIGILVIAVCVAAAAAGNPEVATDVGADVGTDVAADATDDVVMTSTQDVENEVAEEASQSSVDAGGDAAYDEGLSGVKTMFDDAATDSTTGAATDASASVGTQGAKTGFVDGLKTSLNQSLGAIAKQGASTTATQIGLGVAKQMTILFAASLFMSSNAIQDSVGALASKLGADQTQLDVINGVFSAVAMVVMVAVLGGGEGADAKGAASATQEASDVADSTTSTLDSIKNSIQSNVNRFTSALSDLPADTMQALKDLPGDTLSGLKNMLTLGIKVGEDGISADPTAIIGLIKTVPMGVQMYADIQSGQIALEMAALLKEQGQIQAAIDVLQQLIQMLTKLMNSISAGIGAQNSTISQLNSDVQGLFKKASASLSKLDNAGFQG